MCIFTEQCSPIIDRYVSVIYEKGELPFVVELKPLEGDETNDVHLLWMLTELLCNKEQSETKKHRWLGYVQGVMITKKYMTVLEERELTRNILNGS